MSSAYVAACLRVAGVMRRAISAFTRVFDALWLLRRTGTQEVFVGVDGSRYG
jgi:hypothetical protein